MIPWKSYTPAIENIIKKKKITSIVSLNSGIEVINDDTITLNPSTPEIVLKGLRTLNDLRAVTFTLPPENIYGMNPLTTITKSKMFQPSLRYVFFPNTKPKAEILIIISKV